MSILGSLGIAVASIAGAGAIWLWQGRRISRMLDRCFPGIPLPQPVAPMLVDFDSAGVSSRLSIGAQSWPLSWPWAPGQSELKLALDAAGRVVVSADMKSFVFGPVQRTWSDPTKPRYLFVPDAGDVVAFTRHISQFPWATPFTYSLLGGSNPKWKRYAYDRLRWTKSSGAVLEIVWTDEFFFYRHSGWCDTYNNRLAKVRILR